MKFDVNDYIEGRLELGGCLLSIIVIAIIIGVIVWFLKSLITDFSIGKLLILLVAIVCFVSPFLNKEQ